jgi:hypothetical protein
MVELLVKLARLSGLSSELRNAAWLLQKDLNLCCFRSNVLVETGLKFQAGMKSTFQQSEKKRDRTHLKHGR